MCPIYESDNSQDRFEKDSWRTFEFWEKVEARFLKKRKLWVIATAIVFTGLISIPVIRDRLPKWRSFYLTRKLAAEFNELKSLVATSGEAFEIEFDPSDAMAFTIYRKPSCQSPDRSMFQTGRLGSQQASNEFTLLTPESAEKLGLKPLQSSYCLDPTTGGKDASIGFIPKSDLEASRSDRISVIFLTGESAEISFN